MYAAVDMGGTNTRLALFETLSSTDFAILDRFPTHRLYQEQVAAIAEPLRHLPNLEGVGFAVGAQLTRDGQRIDASYTMPDFVGKPLIADVAAQLAVPVAAANDNVCANLAETLHGTLKPYERAAYLTVSTGTGAGIRLGFIQQQAFLYLAQVGHHIVQPSGMPCGCGQSGCVQTVTGGQSIANRYGVAAADLHDDAAWQEITRVIATAIINLGRIARVEAVCVGGGIGYNAPYIRQHLSAFVNRLSPEFPLTVHFAALGEEAPIIGTMALLHPHTQQTLFH